MSGRYVVREGKVRGKGRYLGPTPQSADWRDLARDSLVCTEASARVYALWFDGRVVKLVPRKPRVTREQVERAAVSLACEDGWSWPGCSGAQRSYWIRTAEAAFRAAGLEVER